jgi:hypothetical protein
MNLQPHKTIGVFTMNTPVETENQRESYRFPIDESRQQAEMRFGKTWMPVDLLDESAGGFGVRIDQDPGTAVGDIVRLRSKEKCYEVEVMHITQCSSNKKVYDESLYKSAYKLGLKRVNEVFEDSYDRPSPLKRIRALWQRPYVSLDNKGLLVGLAVAFFAGCLPAVLIVTLKSNVVVSQSLDDSLKESKLELDSLSTFSNPFKVKVDGVSDRAFAGSPSSDISSGGTGINSSSDIISSSGQDVSYTKPILSNNQKGVWESLVERAKRLTDIEPWKNAVLALISSLLEKMGLSDIQQAETTQLLEYTDRSIANLNATETEDNREEVARKRESILERAYTDLMHMFDDDQQAQWEELVEGEDEKSGS